MSQTEERCAGGIHYLLTRRKVRNINLRVRGDGTVAASAPLRTDVARIDAFVAGHAAWVRRSQQLLAGRAAAEANTPLPSLAEVETRMRQLCERYFPLFRSTCPGGQMPRIVVKEMHSRWGSCSLRTGTLCFARRLGAMPAEAQEYVVVHEFCHFAHPNHSPAFWAAVGEILPDYPRRRKLLRP